MKRLISILLIIGLGCKLCSAIAMPLQPQHGYWQWQAAKQTLPQGGDMLQAIEELEELEEESSHDADMVAATPAIQVHPAWLALRPWPTSILPRSHTDAGIFLWGQVPVYLAFRRLLI